ncbi:MAG: metallophosphoesterase [Gammaproteobacteria bacterium]
MMFILAVLLIYGGMHGYVYLVLTHAYPLPLEWRAALGAWLALMVAAPFLAHLFDRPRTRGVARLAARLGYTWMGLLFLFVCWHLAVALGLAALRVLGIASGWTMPGALDSARAGIAIAATATLLCAVYGLVEAWCPRVRRVLLSTAKLSANPGRIRIVQISDVHVGLMSSAYRIRRLVRQLNTLAPDILVSTGDLVDSAADGLAPFADQLAQASARLGKFAVIGNHECYGGLEAALSFTRRAGFTVLRGTAVTVAGLIEVTGVDDPAASPPDEDEERALAGVSGDRFTVLLKHRPRVRSGSLGRFDLQLSGHTHDGQIFPFGWVVKRAYPAPHGLSQLASRSWLYLSKGTGCWGPTMRVLAPPEITVFELGYPEGVPLDAPPRA